MRHCVEKADPKKDLKAMEKASLEEGAKTQSEGRAPVSSAGAGAGGW